jgi:anti-sigma B factor antagonist
MEFTLEHRDGRLLASGDMTIYQAAAMKTALLDTWQAAGATIALDLANVTEMDTCGLQIVLMLGRRARSEGRSLNVAAASAAAREVLELSGLHDEAAA